MFLTGISELSPMKNSTKENIFLMEFFCCALNSWQHILCLILICNLNHIAREHVFVLIFMTIIDKVER
ncbi:hypothetical protein HNR77_004853 [Paenibacillus sp. JGP012]|nr:hypothetical protein [Paenibacillus sp. JGP012]